MRRLLLSFCPKRYQKRRTGAVAGQRPGMLATAAVNILGSLEFEQNAVQGGMVFFVETDYLSKYF